jgi:hypothetical protein
MVPAGSVEHLAVTAFSLGLPDDRLPLDRKILDMGLNPQENFFGDCPVGLITSCIKSASTVQVCHPN